MNSISWLAIGALLLTATAEAQTIEKFRAAYPAIAPGSTPSWVTAEKGIWRKYGFDVEPILVSGGARAVPALIGQSVQFLFGSDTGVTTAQLQGIPIVRLGVTMNTLGSSLLTQQNVQSVRDLKGKILGISRGRDASYIRLAKLLRDNGLNPNDDVKFLSIGGGEGGRLSALKAGVIHGTMLFPPLDLIAAKEGLKVLQKFDVPTPGGGVNTTAALLKQNRPLVINFLKGYIEGIHYMIGNKTESVRIMQKYFQNADLAAMGYLYDETTRRLEKELRASPESISFHYEMAALDDPRAKQANEKTFWDSSLIEEIRRSGFVDRLYRK
ncbi:MAG TPA: ABC transporter substrate-binding protein [Candidatus Binatia bacterium]|jgi:ABC-type nitrate/sulfonate/bicarbonate transport system substrate-binding protein